MNKLGEATVKVSADTAELEAQLNAVIQLLGQAQQAAEQFASSLEQVRLAFEPIGKERREKLFAFSLTETR